MAGDESIPITGWPPGRLRNRDGHAAVPDRLLDEGAVGLASTFDLEGHVIRHVRRPLVVPAREGLVPTHQ
jgi:hypothetical protein